MLKIYIDDFNSHTREGVTFRHFGTNIICNFNSHTREGVTETPPDAIADTLDFNSHTREGVTPEPIISDFIPPNFNSHTREGVTHPLKYRPWLCAISTHTPVRV